MAKMNILLIEGDAGRRVMLARHLSRRGHCVTIASSIPEAREILQYVGRVTAAPQAIVTAEKLVRRGGAAFREELAACFPEASWIPLRSDLDADWLAFWLGRLADRRRRPSRRGRRPLNVWLVEPHDMMREAMARHLAAGGDRVSACRSLEEARELLARATRGRRAPHAIVAPVVVEGADAIGFYMSVRRRFAKARWIVIPAMQLEPSPRSRAAMKMTSAAVEGLSRAR
jgi:DNA-binding response OmpR family regulator